MIVLMSCAINTLFKGTTYTSRSHLNFSSSSFVVCFIFSILNNPSSFIVYHISLVFSIWVNNYFEVTFNSKVILDVAKITQSMMRGLL